MKTNSIIRCFFLVFGIISHVSQQFKLLDFLLNGFSRFGKKCNCRCGAFQLNSHPRLDKGMPINPSEFPWIAHIYYKRNRLTTGTFINNLYVLTSANKLYHFPQNSIKIALNKYNACAEDDTSLVSASRVIFHPGFLPIIEINDLALIRLATEINTGFPLTPICLPNHGALYNERLVTVVNFITTEFIFDELCFPHKLEIPILPKNRCPLELEAGEDCLGIIPFEKFFCNNDSGAGVQFYSNKGYYELVGVMTAKQSCTDFEDTFSTKRVPIMTTVEKYLHWIYENTQDACYCYKY